MVFGIIQDIVGLDQPHSVSEDRTMKYVINVPNRANDLKIALNEIKLLKIRCIINIWNLYQIEQLYY